MNLFDEEFYALMHPEYKQRSGLALLDYARHGWKEGANPGPLFNTTWYLAANPDAAKAGISPLEHHAKNGADRPTAPKLRDWAQMPAYQRAHMEEIALWLAVRAGLFNEEFYLKNTPEAASEASGLAHYRKSGWKKGNSPSRLLDAKSLQLTGAKICPLVGLFIASPANLALLPLLVNGELRRHCESAGLFDKDYYEFIYPEVAANSQDSFLHFALLGWRLGYNPSERFNTAYYCAEHNSGGDNPLAHALSHPEITRWFPEGIDFALQPDPVKRHIGDIAWRRVNQRGLWDREFYLDEYDDVADSGIDPGAHYKNHGFRENRSPSAGFNAEWYVEKYLDGNIGECAIWDYISRGEKEGLSARPNDEIQVLLEENKLLFEQVRFLQKELLAAKAKIEADK